MKRKEENTFPIDVDKAWKSLYERLDKDNLLDGEECNTDFHKRKILLRWIAVAAAIFVGVIVSFFFFPKKSDSLLLTIQNNEKNGALVFTFDDGSTVYLASNAAITYPSVFDCNHRKVEFNGNALFQIEKDEKRPFIIETNGITIEVVGTVFVVQSSPEFPFELYVKQGKVNIHSEDGQNILAVEAGEIAKLDASGIGKFENTNPQLFSYYTNRMCFKDEKISNIAKAINTIYGSPSIITEESINDRRLTITFDNNTVETMANLICSGLNLEQINRQDTIFIGHSSK